MPLAGQYLFSGILFTPADSFDFGLVSTSSDELFTLRNVKAPVATTLSIEGDTASFRIVGNDCPPTLPTNASCSVTVRFVPQATGEHFASLRETATNPVASVSLRGHR
jgi:hypothetical protein